MPHTEARTVGRAKYGSDATNWMVLASIFLIAMGLPLIVITGSGVGTSSLFWYTSSYQKTKSSAVNGWPSLHFMPRRRDSVVTRPSGLTSHARAMFGTIFVPV